MRNRVMQKSASKDDVQTFEDLGLTIEVANALFAYGLDKPSALEKTALPLLLDRTAGDVRLWAKAGTGKSASLVAAFLEELVRWRKEMKEAKTFWLCWKNRSESALRLVSRDVAGLIRRAVFDGRRMPRLL